MKKKPFYPDIDKMKCRVCGKQAIGWNISGAFCSDEHYRFTKPGERKIDCIAFRFSETGPIVLSKAHSPGADAPTPSHPATQR